MTSGWGKSRPIGILPALAPYQAAKASKIALICRSYQFYVKKAWFCEHLLLIKNAEEQIKLIQEYPNRLIAEVVTGKIDVRHLAPTTGSSETIELAEELEALAGEIEE